MKILATLDGSRLAESIVPQVQTLCALPNAELVLLSVGAVPHGQLMGDVKAPIAAAPAGSSGNAIVVDQAGPAFAETKEQAVDRVKAALHDYLHGIARELPAHVPCRIETLLDDDPRSAIVRFAIKEQPDLIVMATHGRTGLVHALFGDVAESVVRSGIAPVMLVHPQEVRKSRPLDSGTDASTPNATAA